jgi:predicted O-methyltransferase YrrM
VALRPSVRRLALGLATLAGAPRGWFIPYRHAGVRPPAGPDGAYPAAARLLAAAEGRFRTVLGWIDGFADDLLAFDGPPPEPRWTQDWFPRLDGAAAYAVVRRSGPRRIVEIGSGHSTRFMARAVRDGGHATRILAIDPAPRADIARLPVTHLATPVQHVDPSVFADLAAGDVLFIDTSHVAMPGSDVDHLFGTVLPALPAGVLVHVHDVLLPDDYPDDWRWRGYNEQNAVAALLAGSGFALEWGSAYVRQAMAAETFDMPPGAHESSLWLVKR